MAPALSLADGSPPITSKVRELSYAEIDRLLAAFAPLSPDPDWPVWKRDPKPGEEPLRCVIFGPKRHVEYRGSDDAPELVEWTETGNGGMWTEPASMQGRCTEGGRAWSKVAVEREVRYAAAKRADPRRAVRDPAPWDVPGALASPTLRRLAVTSPALLATLPDALGARVGTRYIELIVNAVVHQPVRSVVALDPGGSLTDWATLGWLDRATGEPVKVTTDVTAYGTGVVIAETLGARAAQYGAPPRGQPVDAVLVTPLSVRYLGRVSPVVDAAADGLSGNLARFRAAYEDDRGLGPGQHAALVDVARSMPSASFAALAKVTPRMARQIARDQLPRRSTVRRILTELRRVDVTVRKQEERTCALDGCSHPVARANGAYCACPDHAPHRWAAQKRRQRTAKKGAR